MYDIHTVRVQDSPMEIFLYEPEGNGPHPGIVLAQHIPVGHTGIENDAFTLKTAELRRKRLCRRRAVHLSLVAEGSGH